MAHHDVKRLAWICKMKNRLDLPHYFNELGFTKGAEVGVFTGYFSEKLCQAIPGLDLIACDIWGEGKYKRAEEECLKRLRPYNVTIMKKYSVEAAKDVPDDSLDFVYIDGAHDYDNVKADIEAWAPKVRVGGIISGDDFYDFPTGRGGVMPAAAEYASHHHYDLKLTNWNINDPVRDDRQPSFYFFKTHNNGPQHPHQDESYTGFKK